MPNECKFTLTLLKEGRKERKEVLGSDPVLPGAEESLVLQAVVLEIKYLVCEIHNGNQRGLEFSQ